MIQIAKKGTSLFVTDYNAIISTIFIFLVIVLPNHIIFNHILNSGPLIIWKQFLIVSLIILFISKILNKSLDGNDIILIVLLSIVIFLTIYSLVMGFSFPRVIYAAITYVGFNTALFAPSAIYNNHSELRVFRIIRAVMIFCILGLMVDYFTDIFRSIPRGEYGTLESVELGFLRRSSFFFGASTIVYPFLSFGYVLSVILAHRSNRPYSIIPLWILGLLGSILTAARATILGWVAIGVLVFFVSIIEFKLRLRRILFGLITCMILFYSFTYFVNNIFMQPEFIYKYALNPFDSNEFSNSHRLTRWQEGIGLLRLQPEIIMGHGIGSTMGNVPDDNPVHTHYESSFFQILYEAGLFGLIVIYLPFLYAIYLFFKKPKLRNSFEQRLLVGWLIIYICSIFIAPTVLAFHNQLVYSFICGYIINKAKTT